MKWVTRARPKTDRIACPWLIAKFIDREAEILYVPADQVLDAAAREDAISFDAPGARYTHRDGKCTFEVLIEDYHLDTDAALARLDRWPAAPGRPGRCRGRRRCRRRARSSPTWRVPGRPGGRSR